MGDQEIARICTLGNDFMYVRRCIYIVTEQMIVVAKIHLRKMYSLYPSIRSALSKLWVSIKPNSKLLLGFPGEDLWLLTWKDACDILSSGKYSIYHMIPIMHNYIHRSFSEHRKRCQKGRWKVQLSGWVYVFL